MKQVPAGEDQTSQLERRRRMRLSLTSELFRVQSNGKIFSVVDLSAKGMLIRVLDSNDLLLFPVGTILEGRLSLKRDRHALTVVVRNIRKAGRKDGAEIEVGLEFVSLSEGVHAALHRFLSPEELAQDLQRLPWPGGDWAKVQWFHGASGTDLVFESADEGGINRVSIYIHAVAVQWSTAEGLNTGKAELCEQGGSQEIGLVRLQNQWILKDAEVDFEKLGVAKTLVLSSNLSEDLKTWASRHLVGVRST